MGPIDTSRPALIQAAAIGLAYGVLAAGAIGLTRLSGGIALLWLAGAPLIAALAVAPRRRWVPLIGASIIGSLIASCLVSPFYLFSPIFAVANVGEATLAALLLRRWGVGRSVLDSAKSIGLFLIAATIVAPFAGGAFLTTTLSLFTRFNVSSTLFDWQLGHGIGNMIGGPFALMWTRRDIDWQQFRARGGVWIAIGCTILLGATTGIVFGQNKLPLLFLPVVPLLVATFQLHRFGASGGVLLIALIGGVLTVNGSGPIMLMHMNEAARLQFFQFYLAVMFLTALPVAAALWQRDKLALALGESEARYRLLADNATDIMLTLDPDGLILFASPAVRDLGYYDPEALIGRNAVTLVMAEDRDRVMATHRDALAAPDRTFSVEYRAVRADGSIGWFETNTRAVRAANRGRGAVVSVIRDLGGRKKREAELERAATTDALTGLLNRAAFRHAATEAMIAARRGKPSTLAILDLDHFKRINDTYGHATGDDALLMVADLLRDQVRDGDLIGRIGGEEFAILFRGLPLVGAAPVCDRLRIALSECPLDHRGVAVPVTMSAGLAELCPGFGIDAVFAGADAALYRAKAAGRNQIAVASDLLAV